MPTSRTEAAGDHTSTEPPVHHARAGAADTVAAGWQAWGAAAAGARRVAEGASSSPVLPAALTADIPAFEEAPLGAEQSAAPAAGQQEKPQQAPEPEGDASLQSPLDAAYAEQETKPAAAGQETKPAALAAEQKIVPAVSEADKQEAPKGESVSATKAHWAAVTAAAKKAGQAHRDAMAAAGGGPQENAALFSEPVSARIKSEAAAVISGKSSKLLPMPAVNNPRVTRGARSAAATPAPILSVDRPAPLPIELEAPVLFPSLSELPSSAQDVVALVQEEVAAMETMSNLPTAASSLPLAVGLRVALLVSSLVMLAIAAVLQLCPCLVCTPCLRLFAAARDKKDADSDVGSSMDSHPVGVSLSGGIHRSVVGTGGHLAAVAAVPSGGSLGVQGGGWVQGETSEGSLQPDDSGSAMHGDKAA
jgi:hypothetical protein